MVPIYSYSIHWLEGGLCVGYSNEAAAGRTEGKYKEADGKGGMQRGPA